MDSLRQEGQVTSAESLTTEGEAHSVCRLERQGSVLQNVRPSLQRATGGFHENLTMSGWKLDLSCVGSASRGGVYPRGIPLGVFFSRNSVGL